MKSETIQRVRQRLREQLPSTRLSGLGYFYLLNAYLIALIAGCLLLTRDVTWAESITVPITFVYANLVEYWGHRIPMHRPIPLLGRVFRGHTLQHHLFFSRDAMECEGARDIRFLVFPPSMIFFFTFAFVIPAGALLYLVATANIACLFAATVCAYYLNYELMHALYHVPRSHWINRIRWIRARRISHEHHHDHELMSHYNFNITYPLGDRLFGTRYVERGSRATTRARVAKN